MQIHSLEVQTVPNFKYGVILPIVNNSYLPKIYRITYFNPFKNILGKVIPYAFLRFDIPLNILLTYTYNGFLLEN